MGAKSCLLCPKGFETDGTGNVECTACSLGYYNNLMGGWLGGWALVGQLLV